MPNTGPVNACVWPVVSEDADTNECIITNTPDDVSITVNKTWVIAGADQGFDGDYQIKVNCPGSIVNGVPADGGPNDHFAFTVGNAATGPESFEFSIAGDELAFGGTCHVQEHNDDNVVQSTFSGGCSENTEQSGGNFIMSEFFDINAGDAIDCDITNTVFFNGIPALNQYGLAVLALLLLAVGFVALKL